MKISWNFRHLTKKKHTEFGSMEPESAKMLTHLRVLGLIFAVLYITLQFSRLLCNLWPICVCRPYWGSLGTPGPLVCPSVTPSGLRVLTPPYTPHQSPIWSVTRLQPLLPPPTSATPTIPGTDGHHRWAAGTPIPGPATPTATTLTNKTKEHRSPAATKQM